MPPWMKASGNRNKMRPTAPPTASPREVCGQCYRPMSVCYCEHLVPQDSRTRVLILRHTREREVGIGTARMALLGLRNACLRTDVDFSHDSVVNDAIAAGNTYVLYPTPDALPVETTTFDRPINLIVLDGTWWQARKLLRSNPALKALPTLRMTPKEKSLYGQVRREPADDYVGTVEAIAYVLGHLEKDHEKFQTLLRPLKALVEKQLHFAKTLAVSRHRLPVGAPRPKFGLPLEVVSRQADLVCIHGEANAWSRKHPDHRDAEMVHWLAERVATGERFEAIIAPRGKLSPTSGSHIDLPDATILAGETWSDFVARWRAFLRPTDLLLTWGHFALATLAKDGFSDPPPHIDLRPIAGNILGRRTGTLEDCASRMELPLPKAWGQGRGGRRLARFLAITQAFLKDGGHVLDGEVRGP